MSKLIRRVTASIILGVTLVTTVAPLTVYAESTIDAYKYQQATKTKGKETNIDGNTGATAIEGSQANPSTAGTTLDGMSTAEKQQVIENNAASLDELKNRLRQNKELSNLSDTRLTAMAWCIAETVKTLKDLGYSEAATAGILGNIRHESYCNPYIIQGQSSTSFDIFCIGSNITLTINGENPYTSESDGAKADALLYSPSRINKDYSGGATPNAGVGLIQFTDCSTDYSARHTMADLKKGFRRSNVVNEWKQDKYCNDPWTAILKTNQYTYWTPSSYTDTTQTYDTTDEEGNTATQTMTITDMKAPLSHATSDKLNMAGIPNQLAFMDSQDRNCWMATAAGKQFLERNGIPANLESFDQYKSINCTATEAIAYWCAYMERPGSSGLNTIIERASKASMSAAEDWCPILIGIADDYYGGKLDLGTLTEYGVNPTSALAGEDVGNGIYSKASLQAHNSALAHSGYLNESQCSDIMVQSESLVGQELLEIAKREYLKQQELDALVDWENEVRVNSFENTLVLLGRRIVIFAGIILMIWSILLYLAYWFDRLNTVSFIDLLGKMSFGHLCIADTEANSTFFNKTGEGQKVKVKTVSHRAILTICCMGFALSTMMVTGLIFKLLYAIVMKIYNFLQ